MGRERSCALEQGACQLLVPTLLMHKHSVRGERGTVAVAGISLARV